MKKPDEFIDLRGPRLFGRWTWTTICMTHHPKSTELRWWIGRLDHDPRVQREFCRRVEATGLMAAFTACWAYWQGENQPRGAKIHCTAGWGGGKRLSKEAAQSIAGLVARHWMKALEQDLHIIDQLSMR